MALVVGMLGGPATAQSSSENRADLVLGSGSDTTYGVMTALDELYNASPGCRTEISADSPDEPRLDLTCVEDGDITTENADHDVAAGYFPLGSSNGVQQLCQQGLEAVAPISYARSSRTPGDDDCDNIRFVGFAGDAIPWVAFTAEDGGEGGVDVPSLTQAELQDIFVNCAITNWSEVGGPDLDIVVYAAQEGSGTRATFDGFVGGDSTTCIPDEFKDGGTDDHVIFENDATPIVENGDQAGAIFYYAFGPFNVRGGEGTELKAIDDVEATDETIIDNSYPYSRTVYNVYRTEASDSAPASDPDVVEYVGEDGWICKPDSEHSVDSAGVNYGERVSQTISDQGFVPFPVGPTGGGVAGESKCRVAE